VTPFEAFFTVHQGLPREGAGSDACTREALNHIGPLPPNAHVVDLGCGPGAQTLVLAETLQTKVIAVDRIQGFLEELTRRAKARSLGHLIEPIRADFKTMTFKSPFDLIWCEGAAFILGFENALKAWKPLLKPGGVMALTDCSWLTDSPPAEAAAFWSAGYPTMGTVTENCARAEGAGFDVIHQFTLPPSAWWDDYYTPLALRCDVLEKNADETLLAAVTSARREIDIYRRYGASYSYVFYILRRREG
jgi:serine/threonine-protein kinase HipA